jgi:HSP20 family protein
MGEEKTVRGMLTGLVDLLKALDELAQKGEVKREWKKGPYAVEYRRSVRYIRSEPGAPAAEVRPHIELKPKPLEVEVKPKEPLIDVFDRGDHIAVVASIPNVKEEDLKFEVAGDVLKINANVAGTKIEKGVSIPWGSEVDKILGASFKNGILEIKLRKKPRTPKEKG